jgi:thiopeptide-type bacteriocin biosynthesis protein
MMPCQPANFFLLRTPLLPFDRWWSWTCGSVDEALLREGLRAVLTPAFREALYLASPDLYRGLEGWLSDPEDRRSRAVEAALVAYFSRSADRATPFGLFAGISSGRIAQHSNLELPGQAQYRKKIRLDLRYLDALAEMDRAEGAIYRPNTTIFRRNDKIRYLESHVDLRTGFRNFRLIDCHTSHALEMALHEAAPGASADAIIARLAADQGSLEDARDFLAQLVEAQLLVADSRVELSGDDASCNCELAGALSKLSALEDEGIGSDVNAYRVIESHLPQVQGIDTAPRFFVDLLKPTAGCSLGRDAVNEVCRGIDLLRKIARPDPDMLAGFKQSFIERYGSSEVPLLEALDEESGIQLSRRRQNSTTGIIKGIFRTAGLESPAWTSYEDGLLRVVASSLGGDKRTIELQSRDVEALASETTPDWPSRFAVNVRFFAPSAESLDSGDFQYTVLAYLAGPALMGRFASVDSELREHLQGWLQSEVDAQPACVFGEIVHVPQGERLSQIICRPRFYRYQIPLLATCSVPEEYRIAVSDLKVSVRADRVVLRSERLNREVIPRLPVAHNFRKGTNLQLYRFLCELQYQGRMAPAIWVWPAAMQTFPFLPRLTYGRLIVSLARWRIDRDEIDRLSSSTGPGLLAEVNGWRSERKIPRFVRLFESDCHIPVDFENVLSVRCMVRSIRRSAFAFVEEMFQSEGLCVRSGVDRFQHEMTIPFTADSAARPPVNVSRPEVRHIFSPGSEWVYAKIYASPVQQDGLLVGEVPRLLQSVRNQQLLEKWFFIRYADPEPHLRLRFQARTDCEKDLFLAVQEHTRCWIAAGLCWRIQFDTYLPEADRYGIDAIDVAEGIFCADSEAVLDVVRQKNTPRWLLAMLGIDSLLADFGMDAPQRLAWTREVCDAFQKEFSKNVDSRKLGLQHRSQRVAIGQSFAGASLFAPRSEHLRPLVQRLAELACTGAQVIADYTHMHVNRMLPVNQRQTEFVLYEFLRRWYAERVATKTC